MWDGVRKAFHILCTLACPRTVLYCAWSSFLQNWDRRIINKIYFIIYYYYYSPPGRPLEKKVLVLVSVSPSVSVALVSTLATVSVHFCLCRVGFHTCHSVSPLLSLSRWSPPHLPQCQSTSVSVALVSTLATVSVHFCLCRLGHHTCHDVSPQRPQVSQSLSVWLYRRHH